MAVPPLKIRVTADTADAESGLRRVETQMGKTASRTTRYSRNADAAAGSTANLAAQFNDIGVMLAAGQSPLLLAVQQGTQVNQVMGQIGTTGAARVKALGTAFMSIISPANLATLGIIAGGAALVQWGMSAFNAGEDADDFAGTVENLNDLVDRSDKLIGILESSVEDLSATYLSAANRTREFAAAQAELIASQAESRLADQLSILNGELEEYINTSDGVRGASNAQRQAIDNITESFGVSREEARALKMQLEALAMAGDFEAQTTALQNVLTTLEDMGVPLSDIPPELQKAIDEMITLVRETDRAKAAMDQLSASAAGVTIGVPLFDQNLEGGLLPPASSEDTGGGRSRGRSRGGGGGRSRERQREQELQRFIKGLQTEREILEEWRVEQLELLAEYTDKELEAIGGKNEAKLRLEQEYEDRLTQLQKGGQQTRLAALQGAMSDAANLMQSGNEKLFKIGKAFAVANAVVSGYEAATEAWAKGMAVGGPPVAAAFTAASLARTGALISSLQGTNPGGSGGGRGSGSGAGTSAQSSISTQRVDINIVGGNDRDRVVAKEVINALNNAQRDGFRLDPRLIGV